MRRPPCGTSAVSCFSGKQAAWAGGRSCRLWLRPQASLRILIICASAAWPAGIGRIEAAEPAGGKPKIVRELFVPFEDLHVLLEHKPHRVLLSRPEYEQLLARAKVEEAARPPRELAIVAAEYHAAVSSERATIKGTLNLVVFQDGLHAVGLDLAGVGLRAARLDGQGAPIGRADDGRLVLFVEGTGGHALELELVAPLETTAAQQVLNFRVPTPAATRFELTVPGDVEIRSGTEAVSRVVDESAGVTRFVLVPRREQVSLTMTLNSRLLRKERVVVARSVIVNEVTQAYERIHATFSMAVLHKAVEHFQFAVPDGFEITDVKSPLLARWSMAQQADRRVLDVYLREQTTDTVVLNLSALRSPSQLDQWSLPALEPIDVAGQVAVVGLLVEDRLKARNIETQGLLPIDTAVLTAALPASVFEAEPGAPRVRPVVAYYAPQSGFGLSAGFRKPEARVLVTTNLLLTLTDKDHRVRGGFTLQPEVEKLFTFDFTVPAGWHVTRVTTGDDKPLVFERYGGADEAARIHVRLPQGVMPGQPYVTYFEAESSPGGWLGDWETTQATFPVFAVVGATRDVGAVAVAAHDDLAVRPESLEQLAPLDENEKGNYGLGGVPTNLAYRYESTGYHAVLTVEHIEPRLTARTYSFFVIKPDVLVAHYELAYDIEQARARELALVLPASTPAALSIRGLDGVGLKEYRGQPTGQVRRWTVILGERRRDTVRLAVDFQQPLATEEPRDLALPIVHAADVAYQSGLAAVEGSAELDVQIASSLRKADIGELVDAEYKPGKRLLGAYRFVGDSPAVAVSVFRHPTYSMPPVIVQRAELVTLVSAEGLSQTAARFELRTKAPFLEAQLPAGSILWSVELDGRPAKPQRQNHQLLLSLPAGEEATLRDLRIVYETPVDAAGLVSDVEIPAPRLLVRTAPDQPGTEVPVADLLWHLHAPTGYRVIRSGGTLTTDEVFPPEPAITLLARWVLSAGGGFNPFYWMGSLARARKVSYELAASVEEAAADGSRLMKGDFDGDGVADDVIVGGTTYLDAMRDGTKGGGERAGVPEGEEEWLRTSAAGEPAPATVAGPSKAPMAEVPEMGYLPAGRVERFESGGAWALQGLRSLKIDLAETGRGIAFRSLWGKPRLDVTMANERRFDALVWGLALAVVLGGLILVNRPARRKASYVVLVALITALLPLVTASAVLISALNHSFLAAALLVPVYLAIGLFRWLVRLVRASMPSAAVAAAVLALAITLGAAPDVSAESPTPVFVQVVESPEPVKVPEDAIIVPYDPKTGIGVREADQLLVPYAEYTRLWNLAHPDRKITVEEPPAPYALAGAAFEATLAGDEYLLIEGRIELDVYADETVTVPLPLQGGVLAKAELDGRPARLSLARPAAKPQPKQRAAQAARRKRVPGESLIVLYASGKGRHRLDLAIRMHLDRRGGWRVAAGRVPAAPASALTLHVPEPQTEVRLSGVTDRPNYLTAAANERIHSALGLDGSVTIRWRPKVSEGEVDQSLTAESQAVLDVQEDGLRLMWAIKFAFRRGERTAFRLHLPGGYLAARVEGGNVRGWEMRAENGQQVLDVTLLKPAKEQETFTLHLWRQGAGGQGELARFAAPIVAAPDAALHQGRIVIRRSPLLDVRTAETAGVTRSDLPAKIEDGRAPLEVSPLGIRPYQAYRFAATPFRITLEVSPVAARTSAFVQTILRIGERQRDLETKIDVDIRDRLAYGARVLLPEDLELERVTAPGKFEWALTEHEGQKLLTVYLSAGQTGQIPIVITGRLGERGEVEQVALPRIEALDVERQEGDIVVQADPAFNIKLTELAGCESVLMKRVYGWLDAGQRGLARAALHYESPDYKGLVRLTVRTPSVRCYTVTNVRVTDRAIEETVLCDFTVQLAGIRELSFILPGRFRDSRISVPQLRQKTIEPVSTEPDAPVRVRLELQDKLMGQIRVLVENDQLLTPDVHTVPLPVVETGRTRQRYVLIESAGRDEVVIEKTQGLEELGRKQREWARLQSILGQGITQAYLVQPDAAAPALEFRTQERAIVETVGARIALTQTLLVLDEGGTYRAIQSYRLDNSTEQSLEIVLPAGAELWTARVAGEPVKPTRVPDANKPRNVRIPLVKTAPGDLDYEVEIKYGGTLPGLGELSSLTFPLIRTVNVNVELSQVRLCLPETYKWFDFGGTMSEVEEEGDLAAGVVAYQTRQAERLTQTMRKGGAFAKIRAAENLKQLKVETEALQRSTSGFAANPRLQQELVTNADVIEQAGKDIERVQSDLDRTVTVDNRITLNEYYVGQRNTPARGAVNYLGSNFGYPVSAPASPPATQPAQAGEVNGRFNTQWFDSNALGTNTLIVTATPQQIKEIRQRIEGLDVATKTGAPSIAYGFDASGVQLADRPQAPALALKPEMQSQFADVRTQTWGARLKEQKAKRAEAQRSLLRYQAEIADKSRELAARRPAGGSGPGSGHDRRRESASTLDRASGRASTLLGMGAGRRGYAGGVAFGDGDEAAGLTAGAVPVAPAGLASLDVEIPRRGVVYRFTTPRGEVEITARAVSRPFMVNIENLVLVLAIALVGWGIYRFVSRADFIARYGRSAAVTLVVLGAISVVVGVLPVIALLACIGGITLGIHSRRSCTS